MSFSSSKQPKKPRHAVSARSRTEERKRRQRSKKVRRDFAGGKRADGRQRKRRIVRPDPQTIRVRASGENLSGVGGLLLLGGFLRRIGLDAQLRERFERLKADPRTIYPMAWQMRLLIDAFAAGEDRVFGLESLATDPLFVALAGGVVPSLDTCYRDLCRFDDPAIAELEDLMAHHGLELLRRSKYDVVHIDIDTTVEPLFGTQEGALPGPNPHYHGRPSYHPILARVEETNTIVAAKLRPGDTGLGKEDIPWIERTIERVREVVGPDAILYVRIDAAGDTTEILEAITRQKAFFVVKARLTQNLAGTIATIPESDWTTTEWDADGKPREQVAVVNFVRSEWPTGHYRVVALRSIDRPSGKQVFLWNGLEYTAQAYVTNEWFEAPENIPARYNLRAGIEPLIGDLKNGWGIGKIPSQVFEANHAILLLKLLAHNVMRRFVAVKCPELLNLRTAWLRRVLVNVPARLLRSGRRLFLEIPPKSMLARMPN